MCGIIAYVGRKKALPILINGLKALEYRGYDSAGVAVLAKDSIFLEKCAGRISVLEKRLDRRYKNFANDTTCGIGHCLAPDTLIQLADGRVMRIEDLPEEVEVLSLDTKSFTFVPKKGRVFRHKSPPTLIEICTPTSFIRCTPEHRMFIWKKSQLMETVARSIRPGDIVCFAKRVRTKGEQILFVGREPKRYWQLAPESISEFRAAMAARNLSITALATEANTTRYFIGHMLSGDRNAQEAVMRKLAAALALPFPLAGMKPTHSHHGNFIQIPSRSSSELMQILGYFLGDGHAHERSVRWKDARRELLEHYQSLLSEVFNLEGRIVPIPNCKAWLLEVNSLELVHWLQETILHRRTDFYNKIGKLPENELRAFLRGIFDAEGFVSKQAGQIALCMIDGNLVRRIQQWLLRFEIISSISIASPNLRQRRPRSSFRLSISSVTGARRFSEYIGFTASDKQSDLWAILQTKKPIGTTLSYHYLPLRREEITPLLKNAGIRGAPYRIIRGNGFPAVGVIEKFFQSLDVPQNDLPIIDRLKLIFDGDVVFQSVKAVRQVKSESSYVYDIEVPETANFLANGLLSHNSRWATHGIPSDVNAHPHADCRGEFFVVHNGIIENHQEIKSLLEKQGHKFVSETDTEVISHLLERKKLENRKWKLEHLVLNVLPILRGTYALAIVSKSEPGKVVVAKHFSPLLIGLGRNENFAASDASAILPHTKKVLYLNDGEVAVLTKSGVKILSGRTHRRIKRTPSRLEWSVSQAKKGGFPHFMLKEIVEVPQAMENAMRGRNIAGKGFVKLGGLEAVRERLKKVEKLYIVACGSAHAAGRYGEYIIEDLAGLDVETDIASEFRYRNPLLDSVRHALLAVSQSGETADTLAAVDLAKSQGVLTLGIVNVVGSSIAQKTDAGIYQYAGPEIGVATTKAFSSQLTILALFAIWLSDLRSKISEKEVALLLKELAELPAKAKKIIEERTAIEKIAQKYAKYQNFFVLGRKYSVPIAYEGAIKIKEITYAHAEGYGAGEMKHGPIAMVDKYFATIGICPQDSVYEKMLSNLAEIKARGGPILAIAAEGDKKISQIADDVIYIPKTLEQLTPLLSVIPLQLLAYYMGVRRGLDVDKPRNLAKSVTVE